MVPEVSLAPVGVGEAVAVLRLCVLPAAVVGPDFSFAG